MTPVTVDGNRYVVAGVANARAAGEATLARGRAVFRLDRV